MDKSEVDTKTAAVVNAIADTLFLPFFKQFDLGAYDGDKHVTGSSRETVLDLLIDELQKRCRCCMNKARVCGERTRKACANAIVFGFDKVSAIKLPQDRVLLVEQQLQVIGLSPSDLEKAWQRAVQRHISEMQCNALARECYEALNP